MRFIPDPLSIPPLNVDFCLCLFSKKKIFKRSNQALISFYLLLVKEHRSGAAHPPGLGASQTCNGKSKETRKKSFRIFDHNFFLSISHIGNEAEKKPAS